LGELNKPLKINSCKAGQHMTNEFYLDGGKILSTISKIDSDENIYGTKAKFEKYLFK
jgi:hypothetical protein